MGTECHLGFGLTITFTTEVTHVRRTGRSDWDVGIRATDTGISAGAVAAAAIETRHYGASLPRFAGASGV